MANPSSHREKLGQETIDCDRRLNLGVKESNPFTKRRTESHGFENLEEKAPIYSVKGFLLIKRNERCRDVMLSSVITDRLEIGT